MPKNLFLDDTRKPKVVFPDDANNWDLVTTYEEFVKYLNDIADSADENNMPPIVSFDYVLGDVKDGESCAKFLAEFCIKYGLKLPTCYVHSSYPNATGYINRGLDYYYKATGDPKVPVPLIRHSFFL